MANAVVTLSIGDRPFFEYTSKSIKEYANKIGADYHSVLEYKVPSQYKDIKIGRTHYANNEAYFIKLLVIRDFLEKYDRVIFLDDTCVVNTDCPDLFNIVPRNFVGAHNEGILEWPDAALVAKDIFNELDLPANFLAKHDYINTGVLVFSKEHLSLLSDKSIIELGEQGLFNNECPEQTYLNYVLLKNNTPTFFLPHHFNRMHIHKEKPGERVNYTNYTLEQQREQLYEDFDFIDIDYIQPGRTNHAFIWHIVSFYRPKYRVKLIKRLYNVTRNIKRFYIGNE